MNDQTKLMIDMMAQAGMLEEMLEQHPAAKYLLKAAKQSGLNSKEVLRAVKMELPGEQMKQLRKLSRELLVSEGSLLELMQSGSEMLNHLFIEILELDLELVQAIQLKLSEAIAAGKYEDQQEVHIRALRESLIGLESAIHAMRKANSQLLTDMPDAMEQIKNTERKLKLNLSCLLATLTK